MFCPICGHENNFGAKFCDFCGKPLKQRTETPSAEQTTPLNTAVSAEQVEKNRPAPAQSALNLNMAFAKNNPDVPKETQASPKVGIEPAAMPVPAVTDKSEPPQENTNEPTVLQQPNYPPFPAPQHSSGAGMPHKYKNEKNNFPQNSYMTLPDERSGKKGSRSNKAILISVIAVFLVVAAVGTFFGLRYLNAQKDYNNQIQMGENYLKSGNYEDAADAFQKAIDLNPKGENGYLYMADAYVRQENRQRAIDILQNGLGITESEVIRKKLDKVNQDSNLGNSHADSAADRNSDNASRTSSTSDDAQKEYEQYMNTANTAYKSQQYGTAITALKRAETLCPTAEDPYLVLSNVYVDQGDLGKAAQILQDGYAKTKSDIIMKRLNEIKNNDSASQEDTSKPTSKASNLKSEVSNATTAIDYSSYVGKWYDKSYKNETEFESSGGYCLQIDSVNSNQMVFSLMSVQSPPANRIASIENAVGLIDGGSVSFAFAEDGWGNAGKGVLKLKEGEIYVQVTTTTQNLTAMWDLNIDGNFKKLVR